MSAAATRPVALVAGGSGAIGSAICRRLARSGWRLVFTYRTGEARARALESELRTDGADAVARAASLENPADCAALIDATLAHAGRIDAVVYAAGPHLAFTFISRISPETWRQVMDADVNGCFNLLSAALPHLRAAGNGAIVAVTTAATTRVPVQDILSAAPKVAIEMLVKGIAKEEGRFGLRANCVGPGFTTDGIGGEILSRDADVAEMLRKGLPMKRFGSAADIAACVGFLLSPDAGYITGQCIAVDGGLQL